jgi:hypothetical protein
MNKKGVKSKIKKEMEKVVGRKRMKKINERKKLK